jgi:hypothetical protein
MAMDLGFDIETIAPEQGPSFEVWPHAKYPVRITGAEIMPVNGAPHNLRLVYQLTCMQGPMQGKVHPYGLNIHHDDPQTREISRKQLSALCHATGRRGIRDAQQLVGADFIAEIGPQRKNPEYSEVKRVFDVRGGEPGKAQSTPAAPAPAPAYINAVPAYAQPGPAPTPAAPAAPAGGWAAPAQGATAPTPAWPSGQQPVPPNQPSAPEPSYASPAQAQPPQPPQPPAQQPWEASPAPPPAAAPWGS